MSEEILKIKLSELTTVRIKLQDGTTVEVPLARLKDYSMKALRQRNISQAAHNALIGFADNYAELCHENSDVEIEFAIVASQPDGSHGIVRKTG